MACLMDGVLSGVEPQTPARHSLDLGHHYHHKLHHPLRPASATAATTASGAPHATSAASASRCPLDGAFVPSAPRQPRVRRCSADGPPFAGKVGGVVVDAVPAFSFPSAKQRVGSQQRRRRFSIAIGETVALRTIKEQDDVASAAVDQQAAVAPATHTRRGSSSSYHSTLSSSSNKGRFVLAHPAPAHALDFGGLAAGARPGHSATAVVGGGNGSSSMSMRRRSMLGANATQGYFQQRQQQQAQVLQLHHAPERPPVQLRGHGLTQDQIWRCLQQGEQRQAVEEAAEQLWDADADYCVAQQQQQLQELTNSTRSASFSSRSHSAATSRRHSQVQEHRHAMSALSMIEHELQQLLAMQQWLAGASAVAAPGSHAAAACESARFQHELVLQQAVAAHGTIQAAVFDAAAALDEWGASQLSTAGHYDAVGDGGGGQLLRGDAAARAARWGDDVPCSAPSSNFEFSGFDDFVVFEEEKLYPADAESLLQHFGHYAAI